MIEQVGRVCIDAPLQKERNDYHMNELGNLSIVCAQRPEVLMQIHDGVVAVYVGAGCDRAVLHSPWNDNAEIRRIVHELNFGKYAAYAKEESK